MAWSLECRSCGWKWESKPKNYTFKESAYSKWPNMFIPDNGVHSCPKCDRSFNLYVWTDEVQSVETEHEDESKPLHSTGPCCGDTWSNNTKVVQVCNCECHRPPKEAKKHSPSFLGSAMILRSDT